MPPMTAAVKALMPGRKPVMWVTLRKSRPQRMPATPAIAPPTANVVTMVRLTLIPMRAAISLSSATARIALPVFVRSTRYQSPTIETAATTRTRSLVPAISKVRIERCLASHSGSRG